LLSCIYNDVESVPVLDASAQHGPLHGPVDIEMQYSDLVKKEDTISDSISEPMPAIDSITSTEKGGVFFTRGYSLQQKMTFSF
jgi:hypothetical protein